MPHRALIRNYVLLWGFLVITGLACRPLTPVDETRAVSVAWEMWQHSDFLVPHLNGEFYSHKPPLLQWAIHLGWLLAGVNDWTPRLVAPLFGLANLFLTAGLARRLWPDRSDIHRLAPLMLLSFPVWALWTTLTLYDMLVVFFTLLGMLGVLRVAQGGFRTGWLLAGIAIGGGVLSKGPVILLFILPMGLFAPWWMAERPKWGWLGWYLGLLSAVLLGAALALVWAIPAGLAGGEEYRHAIFWGQSAGRIAHSFAHRRPWWWYAAILPILLFPWGFRISLWRSRSSLGLSTDAGMRFCLVHGITVTLLLSLISGKQVHYVLPVLPAVALTLTRLSLAVPNRYAWLDLGLLGGILIALGTGLIFLPMVQDANSELGWIAEAAPLAAKLSILGIGLLLWLWRPENLDSVLRGTAYALIGFMVTAHVIYRTTNRPHDDLQPMAARLAAVQDRGAAIAHWGKYSGEFQFLGRLRFPLHVVLNGKELADWLTAHPDDYVLIVYRGARQSLETTADFAQVYRGSRRAGLWRASVLNADPEILANLIQ
jgi:4-amino-4-deoxy-L-arabinose transferase-like glycosyltransferase